MIGILKKKMKDPPVKKPHGASLGESKCYTATNNKKVTE